MVRTLDNKNFRLRRRWNAIKNKIKDLIERIKNKYVNKIRHYSKTHPDVGQESNFQRNFRPTLVARNL